MAVIVGRALPDVRTASSRCTAGSSTRCTTAATVPTAVQSAPASSATSWVSTTPRRLGDLRHPRPARPAVGDAGPAGRRPGQLRLAGQRPAAAMRYTECRMAPAGHGDGPRHRPETVDISPTTTADRGADVLPPGSRTCWSTAPPASRSAWPPTSPAQPARGRRGRRLALSTPTPPARSCRTPSSADQGPDFPNGALIVGRQGIEQAYRTGRGSITQRAVIEVDEDRTAAPSW